MILSIPQPGLQSEGRAPRALPWCRLILSLAAASLALSARAQAPVIGGPLTNVAPVGVGPVYALNQFGPVSNPAQAQATFTNASAQLIASGGGVLIIPREAPKDWMPRNNTQGIWLNPAPPAPSWPAVR